MGSGRGADQISVNDDAGTSAGRLPGPQAPAGHLRTARLSEALNVTEGVNPAPLSCPLTRAWATSTQVSMSNVLENDTYENLVFQASE